MKITFLDSGREPEHKPHPDFPKGKDIDLSLGAKRFCNVTLPYPAPRCGLMLVECNDCEIRIGLTVAGRVDDPRTVKIACKKGKH
jgi:hypothetical protein